MIYKIEHPTEKALNELSLNMDKGKMPKMGLF